MPTSVETPDRSARNPDRRDHGGGVFSVLGADLTALLAALLLMLIAVSAFPTQQSVASLAVYLPLHAVVQMFAIVVSILVFAVGWVAYSRERSGNSVLLSCAFLAVSLMDFAYTMAFPGMPDFVTPSSEGKAIDFWLAARGLAACALLSAAVRPWRPFASPRTRYWLLVAALEITALVYWLVLYLEGALPATFIPGQGPTPFKTGAEYTLITVYVLAAAVFYARLRIERADYLRRLFAASCVIMLSELYFIFHWDVADINNLPGHLYNAIAYLLIYQALSVRGAEEPYQRLQRSRQPRQVNMDRRRTGLVSDWWRVGLSHDWYREQDGEAAQAMLAAIVENSNTAIIGCALDRTILSWNAAAERMFGWSASEAIGQPTAIITPQRHHGLLQPLFEQAARGEPVGQVESRHRRRDGTCIDAAGTLVAIRDANGETVFFALTLWDITQQNQLGRAMQQQAALTELLDALARAASEAATPEDAMQSCLERICDYGQWMLGRIGTFAPGQPKSVPRSSIWNCPQPARFDEFIGISNSLDYSLPSGRFTDIVLREKKAVWASDFLVVSESGRLASAAKSGIRCGFVFPVVVGGEALAFLEFFADEVREPDAAFLEAINSVASQLARVIERKQAEQELLESQKQFEQLAEHIPQAFWITDMHRKELIYLSPAHEQIYGQRFSSLQAVWPAWKKAVQAEDRERVLAAYREMGSRGLDERFRILQPGGAMRWVHARGVPVRDADGTVYRVVGTIEDITEGKFVEDALKESEERFRAAFEQAGVGMALHSRDPRTPRWLRVNQKLCDIVGYTREELLELNLVDLTAPDERQVAIDYNERFLRGEVMNYSREKRYLRKDGQFIWVNVALSAVHGPDGRPSQIITVIHDITVARESEMKIRIATERLQRALDGSNLALFDGDLSTREVYLSEAWAAMLGEEPKPTIDTFENLITRVHPEETERIKNQFYDVLKGRTSAYDAVHRVMSRTGEWKWIHSRAKVVERAENGRALRLAGVNADITERVRSEQALRTSEQQLRAITANLPGAVFQFRISAAGEYSFSYLSEGILDLSEIRLEDAMRDHTLLFALIEPEYLPAVCASIEHARTTLETWSCEWPIRTRSGRTKWIRGRAIVARRDDGAVLGDGILTDVTVEKQAEQEIARLNQSLEQRVRERTRQLEATNKELEAFSYSVSHDLRAPLRGIDGFSQLLLKKYVDHLDATGSDYLLRIRRASLRMGELIDDLLLLARLSRSQIKIEPLDVSRLARSILAVLQEHEPERMVVTEVQDGIELSADSHLLKIVLENLLGNAWKFTAKQQPATIRIGTHVQDGELVIFVKDNGAGFDMKFANKLFGAFQRLHSATEFEGTGIGLATVQRILNRHGGRIWADAAVDKGATFYFTLPRCVPDAITPPQKGEAA